MKYLSIFILLVICSCEQMTESYKTEKVYTGINGQYRVDTIFYVLKKGRYLYKEKQPEKDSGDYSIQDAANREFMDNAFNP